MSSPYGDLNRPPLRAVALNEALVRPGTLWSHIEVYDEIDSTNRALADRADAGEPEGAVVIAEHQGAGRGRLDRTWVSPPRAGLTFSVLLRPAPVEERWWGWLPLLTGLAVVEAIRDIADVDAVLKWPNDVLIGGRKVAGLLGERRGSAVVMGIGINVTTGEAELPVGEATSLLLAGAQVTDRDTYLRACLRRLDDRYDEWRAGAGQPAGFHSAYETRCDTLGREIRVLLPDESVVSGRASRIDEGGCLVIASAAGDTTVASGDVIHVLPV